MKIYCSETNEFKHEHPTAKCAYCEIDRLRELLREASDYGEFPLELRRRLDAALKEGS